MKCFGKIAVCLAGGLALNVGLRAAEDVSLAGNPYAEIVTRNVFQLNPIPPKSETEPQGPPPPKITPDGIMGTFGDLQVLFKVAVPGERGKPGKEKYYTLAEGQGEDDIEVLHIDDKNSLVKFNNHGTVQELPLANTSASTGIEPANARNNAPGRPHPPFHLPNGFHGHIPGRNLPRPGEHSIGANLPPVKSYGGSGYNNANNGLNFGGNSSRATYQPPQDNLTPLQQATLMEVQRHQFQQEGVNPAIIPPTALSPLLKDKGGNPVPPAPGPPAP